MDWDGIGESQFKNDNDDNDDDEFLSNMVDTTDTNNDKNGRTRKFAGPTLLSSSSSSLVSSSSSNHQPQPQPPQRSSSSNKNGVLVNERDIQLVSIFERTLPLQVISFVVMTCFILYIGWSGGITNGADRYSYTNNEDIVDSSTRLILEPDIRHYLPQQQQETHEVGPSVFL